MPLQNCAVIRHTLIGKRFIFAYMKKSIFFLCLLIAGSLAAQKSIHTSNTFIIRGDVKATSTITIDQILQHTIYNIGDLKVLNHLGEYKSIQKGLRGVLLKDVIDSTTILSKSPKDLSEVYLIVTATDGYRVVFSWNELFNSPTGGNTYLITEKEGIPIRKMEESILLVTTSDYKTGRRNVKAIKEIVVKRIGAE